MAMADDGTRDVESTEDRLRRLERELGAAKGRIARLEGDVGDGREVLRKQEPDREPLPNPNWEGGEPG